MKKIDPIYEGMYAIETLAKGTFVKLSASSKKVYTVVGYDREFREYELQDYNDISENKWVKKGKKLFAGFCF